MTMAPVSAKTRQNVPMTSAADLLALSLICANMDGLSVAVNG